MRTRHVVVASALLLMGVIHSNANHVLYGDTENAVTPKLPADHDHQACCDACKDRIKSVETQMHDLQQQIHRQSDALKAVFAMLRDTSDKLTKPKSGIDQTRTHDETKLSPHHRNETADHLHHVDRRQLSQPGPAAIRIEQASGRIHFAPENAAIAADGQGHIRLKGSLTVDRDLQVSGKLLSDGTFLNLGVPLRADMPVSQGSLVSLVPGGGVEAGFGLYLSPIKTSMALTHEVLSVSLSGNTTLSLLQKHDGSVGAVYYDMLGTSPETEVAIDGGQPLEHVSVTALAAESGRTMGRFVTCYTTIGVDHGSCAVGEYVTGSGIVMGTALSIASGTRYTGGAVAGVHGSSSRVVLVYNAEDTPGSPSTARMYAVQLVAGPGRTLTMTGSAVMLTPGVVSYISVAAMSPLSLLVAYRLDASSSGNVRELYFNPQDLNTIQRRSIFDFTSAGADPTHISLVGMTSEYAVLTCRLGSDRNKVYSRSIKITVPFLMLADWTLVDAGTTVSPTDVSYRISVAAGSPTRLAMMYADARGRMVMRDAGLYGSAVIVGLVRTADVDAGKRGRAGSVVRVWPSHVACVVQLASGESGSSMSSVRAGRLYGGPSVLGFAKSDAATGEDVYVVLDGGVSGFTGLVPGSLYYARYDGGVHESSDESSGSSSLVVGHAMSGGVLKSLVGTDGPSNSHAISELSRELQELSLRVQSESDRLDRLLPSVNATVESGLARTESITADLSSAVGALESVNASSRIDRLESGVSKAARMWTGYDPNNLQTDGWNEFRLTQLTDTTEGELSVASNQVTIHQAGVYDISFMFRAHDCYHNHIDLRVNGNSVQYSYRYLTQSGIHDSRSLRRTMRLEANDVVQMMIYSATCNSGYYAWYGNYNHFQIRTLALD